jgi:hypothetical protein
LGGAVRRATLGHEILGPDRIGQVVKTSLFEIRRTIGFFMTIGRALDACLLGRAEDRCELSPIAPELDRGDGEPSGQHEANIQRIGEIRGH